MGILRHIILVSSCLAVWNMASAEVIEREYHGFKLWYDCEVGGAVVAHYVATADTGNFPRKHSFFKDKGLPEGCKQQTSTGTYMRPEGVKPTYDLGHLVPANHLDGDKEAIAASNVITNVAPQVSSFNRSGVWRETEKRTECWREDGTGDLEVWILVDWGSDVSNDHFLESHGIVTPDTFAKVVYRPATGKAIAWILPNEARKAKHLDSLMVSIGEVENRFGWSIGLPEDIDTTTVADITDWPKLSCSYK